MGDNTKCLRSCHRINQVYVGRHVLEANVILASKAYGSSCGLNYMEFSKIFPFLACWVAKRICQALGFKHVKLCSIFVFASFRLRDLNIRCYNYVHMIWMKLWDWNNGWHELLCHLRDVLKYLHEIGNMLMYFLYFIVCWIFIALMSMYIFIKYWYHKMNFHIPR